MYFIADEMFDNKEYLEKMEDIFTDDDKIEIEYKLISEEESQKITE